jgi:hypothetical protein
MFAWEEASLTRIEHNRVPGEGGMCCCQPITFFEYL